MRLLILGGTVFLGRAATAEALRRGHEVTLLHRGLHGAGLFPEAEHLIADRTGDLAVLRGGRWDAAIDTSGYAARDVAASSAALAAAGVEHLSFVSTCNVYRDWPDRPVDENGPVWTEDDGEYGPAKAACERAAEAALPGRVAHLRAGLLVGPHDTVFRLPWWVQRVARGGDLPAPGRPDQPLQLVDVRDVAAWMLDLAEGRTAGVFNTTAPMGQTTFAAVLEAARVASGSDARPRWVADDALLAAGVAPWTELPLWAPAAEMPGCWAVDASRAVAAGLRCRPIEETVADVWAWLDGGGAERLPEWNADRRPEALSAERERELLALATYAGRA